MGSQRCVASAGPGLQQACHGARARHSLWLFGSGLVWQLVAEDLAGVAFFSWASLTKKWTVRGWNSGSGSLHLSTVLFYPHI